MASRSDTPKTPTTKKTPSKKGTSNDESALTDWLADYCQQAKLSDAECRSVQEWIEEQFVADEFAKLGEAGHMNTQIPLRHVFVDLPVSDEPTAGSRVGQSHDRFLDLLLNKHPVLLSRYFDTLNQSGPESGQTADELPCLEPNHHDQTPFRHLPAKDNCGGFILVGGPGQGKSTLGQLACQLHRAALLRPKEAMLPTQTLDVLRPFLKVTPTWKNKSAEVRIPSKAMLPLRIELPRFVQWLTEQASSSRQALTPRLLGYLADQPSAKKPKLRATTLLRLAQSMPTLLLLDGFDEVGTIDDRSAVVTSANELLAALAKIGTATAVVVATTRPQGYVGELIGIRFKLINQFLVPLSSSEAHRYVQKLIEAKITGHDEREKVQRNIEEAQKNPATGRLMSTPLLATILVALIQQHGRAPSERWRLFKDYFDFIYRREVERNTYASDLLGKEQSHIEAIHLRVALILQVEAENPGSHSFLNRERLTQVIDQVLLDEEFAPSQREILTEEILAATEKRLVFLVETEPDRFGFDIRPLQEFMAAWALTEGRDETVLLRLGQIAIAPMFRNVLLFATSRLFSERSVLRDELGDKLCGYLDNESNDLIVRYSKSGALLALEMLEEGSVLNQPKRAKTLMEHACGLLDLPLGDEHTRLGRIIDGNTAQVLLNAVERRLVTTDNTLKEPLPAWRCLIMALDRKFPKAEQIAERAWINVKDPTTIYRCLDKPDAWFLSKIEESPERFSPTRFINAPIHWSWLEQPEMGPLRPLWLQSTVRVLLLSPARQIARPIPYRYSVSNPNSERHGLGALLKLQTITKDSHELWGAEIPDCWRGWAATAGFVVSPGAEQLADALEIIANFVSKQDWPDLATVSTWPIAACLRYAKDAETLRDVARRTRRGELGDLVDWKNAEKVWHDHGFDVFHHVINTSTDDVPWTVPSLTTGLPALMLPQDHLLEVGPSQPKTISHSFKNAASAFLVSHSPHERSILARICLHFLGGLKPTDAITLNYDEILSYLREVDEGVAYLVPRPKVIAKKDWLKLLNEGNAPSRFVVPAQMRFGFWVDVSDMLRILTDDPIHPVVLRLVTNVVVVSFARRTMSAVPVDDMPTFEADRSAALSVIGRLHSDSVSIRADVAWLRLALGDVTHAQIPELWSTIQQDTSRASAVWHMLGSILRSRYLSPPVAEELLAHTYLAAPTTQVRRNLLETTRERHRYRRSELNHRSTWIRLELPLPFPSGPASSTDKSLWSQNPIILKRLELVNVRRIPKLTLNFAPPKENQGQWIVLVGPNGTGKTTILRSIVVAGRNLADPAIWPGGVFDAPWPRIGGDSDAKITIDVDQYGSLTTALKGNGGKYYEQTPGLLRSPLFPLFAYGCRRGSALGGNAREVNVSDDNGPEVATLFDEGASLVHAETWLVQWFARTINNDNNLQIYNTILEGLRTLLKIEYVAVEDGAVWIQEHANTPKVPLRALSDGYLTSAGWFLDLIARWIYLATLRGGVIDGSFMSRMTGLVLLDEIDLHLHPQWQMEVIDRTRKLLPRMSFIVTTHNPLTLVGARREEIWELSTDQDTIVATNAQDTPMLLTGGQIYAQYFGIKNIMPHEMGRKLDRYTFLSWNVMRNDDEQREMECLRQELSENEIEPDWEPVQREATPGGTRS